MNFPDAMARYWGEIERNLYAAELACPCMNCHDGCAFNRPEHCVMKKIREVLGEHRPPGLCPHGEEQGKDVVCHSQDGCEFKRVDFEHYYPEKRFCGREQAALAAAEAAEESGRLK